MLRYKTEVLRSELESARQRPQQSDDFVGVRFVGETMTQYPLGNFIALLALSED